MVSFATKNKETKSKEQRINNKDYLKRWIVELSIVYSSRSTCFRPLTLDFRQETFACSRCRTIASCGNNFKSIHYPISLFLRYKSVALLSRIIELIVSTHCNSCLLITVYSLPATRCNRAAACVISMFWNKTIGVVLLIHGFRVWWVLLLFCFRGTFTTSTTVIHCRECRHNHPMNI